MISCSHWGMFAAPVFPRPLLPPRGGVMAEETILMLAVLTAQVSMMSLLSILYWRYEGVAESVVCGVLAITGAVFLYQVASTL